MSAPNELTVRLADEKNWHLIEAVFGNNGGIYRLFAVKNNEPCPIPRVLEVDTSGTLYIGKADRFLNRVIDLKKSILPSYRGQSHDAGKRYKKLAPLQEKFPVDELMIQLTRVDNPLEVERQELQAYINTFGEVPPLNAI